MNSEISPNQVIPSTTEVASMQEVSVNTVVAVKKRNHKPNNKAIDFQLDIDAGAKRIKCRLNGVYKSFNAEAKEIKSEVPLRNDGCFGYRKKNYVVGAAIDRVNGAMIMSSQDNKLTHLDVWILGAITHYRKFLKTAVESRRRKTQPVQINLWLRVVTLSSPQRKELDRMLKQIADFTWEDVEFKVTVKACQFIDEGEGAALEVVNLYEHDHFHLLDLGGGTITFTTYNWDGDELATVGKTPVSGGGMTSIINRIFKSLTRTDRGAIQAENSDIQEALELSALTEVGQWRVPLRSSGKVKDIAAEVEGAMSEWVSGNYAIQKLFDTISQRLAKGEHLYCTGGGFAIGVVADWILKYLKNEVDNANIVILNNPQDVNLAGLKWLENKVD
ncbi:hypothetical protein [Brasilonema sp. UFV-L1]|uniref:hypothetical protein n=1 Tax=Brasilonema sp. UFV-L1 TaxID=2234130 RepID=UPI00145DC3B8|nr:hypothetical protein [Brasilonema sp. UFV-L1]NMG11935.1 hypothetical protein [Brasilonema sp. UFV-L1]